MKITHSKQVHHFTQVHSNKLFTSGERPSLKKTQTKLPCLTNSGSVQRAVPPISLISNAILEPLTINWFTVKIGYSFYSQSLPTNVGLMGYDVTNL